MDKKNRGVPLLVVMSLCACATAPPPPPAVEIPDESAHQDPSNPNPDALPGGVLEWVNYVCNDVQDPAEREKLIKMSAEERGWIFTCPDKPANANEAKPSGSAESHEQRGQPAVSLDRKLARKSC